MRNRLVGISTHEGLIDSRKYNEKLILSSLSSPTSRIIVKVVTIASYRDLN